MRPKITSLFLLFLLISFASAVTLNDVKTYDATTKTASIKESSLGDTKIELELKTELNEAVGIGYQKIAEVRIKNLDSIDYSDIIDSIDTYDINGDKLSKKEKSFDFKYKVTNLYEEPIYEMIEKTSKNGTVYFEENLTGYNDVYLEGWEDFTEDTVLKGQEVILGIFTETYQGEHAEWIPNFNFGKTYQIDEWASWTAGLNVGLVAYYPFEEGTGTATRDVVGGRYNLTGYNTPGWATGIIGNATDLELSSSEYWTEAIASGNFSFNTSFSINAWVKPESQSNWQTIAALSMDSASGGMRWALRTGSTGTNFTGYSRTSATDQVVSGTGFNTASWYMMTYSFNSSGLYLYINGALNSTLLQSSTLDTIVEKRNMSIGSYYELGNWVSYFDGLVDEVGMWNRTLSDSEVSQLWNNGSAITFTNNFDSAPNVTLNLPVNNSNLTVSTYNFNGTVSDDINLTNVSFKLDGVIISTNTSGLNNSLYNFQYVGLTNGAHNWSLLAFDNTSQSTESTRTFNVSVTAPSVTLQSPVDQYNTTSATNNFIAFVTSPDVLVNVSLVQNGTTITSTTNTSGTNNTNYTFSGTFPDGTHTWNILACDAQGDCSTGTTRNINVDLQGPSITLSAPNNQSLLAFDSSLYLNWTVSDTNLQSCWYEYDSTDVLLLNTSTLPSGWFDGNYTEPVGPTTVGNYTFSAANQSANFLTISDVFANVNGTITYNKYYLNLTSCAVTGSERILYLNATSLGGTARQLNFSCGSTVLQTINTGGVGSQRNVAEIDTIREYVTCDSNSTLFLVDIDHSNLTFYANDTYGNEASASRSWSSIVIDTAETYDSSVVETATTSFGIDITYNSSIWTGISTSLWYNGTAYLTTVTGSGNSLSTSKDLDIPSIEDVNATVNFYWNISLTNSTSTYYYLSPTRQQVINEILLEICNISDGPFININTSSTNPTGSLNATLQTTWTVYDSTGDGDSVIEYSYEDLSELNHNWSFCISPSVGNYTVSLQALADATGYSQSNYYLSESQLDGDVNNITMYLLNDSLATLTEIIVVDRGYSGLEDVYGFIQRYDVGSNTYYTIDMIRTDEDGSDLTYLEWYDTWYKFILVQNGQVIKITTPQKISSTPVTIRIGDDYNYTFQKFNDIIYTLLYNETTQNFVLTYTLPSAEVTSACLEVLKRNVTNTYEICNSCETSSSATMFCNIASAGNGTFIANFYATGSMAKIAWLVEFINIREQVYDSLGEEEASSLAFLFAGIVLSFFLINPVMGVIGAVLGLGASIAIGFSPISMTSFIAVVMIGGIVIYLIKR